MNRPTLLTKITGYVLFLGLLLAAIILSCGTILAYIDYASIMIVIGGTFGISVMSGGVFRTAESPRAKLLSWQTVTLGFAITSLAGMGIGLIMMLQNLNDPSSIGPAMAIAVLCPLTALLGIVLFSLPLEDRYNIKIKSYREFSLSRIVWFGFPLLTTFFVYLALFILLISISTITKKEFIKANESLQGVENSLRMHVNETYDVKRIEIAPKPNH